MGCKRAARRVGPQLAAMPTAVNTPIAPAIASGSYGFRPKSRAAAACSFPVRRQDRRLGGSLLASLGISHPRQPHNLVTGVLLARAKLNSERVPHRIRAAVPIVRKITGPYLGEEGQGLSRSCRAP
jgi:hypothetical protein